MAIPQTIDEAFAELRAKPHIDITRQPVGTIILVETTQGIIEMTVLNPQLALVLASSADPKLRTPVKCQMTQSFYDLKGVVSMPKWIGKDLMMQLTFKNTTLGCPITVSATVRGKGWHYEVF